MKNLIFILFVLFVGCSDVIQNPVNSILSDKPSTPQRLIFDLVQYYTCRDSVCPPDITIIRVDTLLYSGLLCNKTFQTGDSVIIFGGLKYYKDSFVLWYSGYGHISLNNVHYTVTHWGYTTVDLYCNSEYEIKYNN